MELAIETRLLTKFYGAVRGCQGVSLAVPPGRIYGFLGPNGAGKSTVVKLLTGLLKPTAGQGAVFGHPMGSREANRQLGFLPEHYRMPEWCSAADALAFYGRLAGLACNALTARSREVLGLIGLSEAANRKIGGFSNGMRQRLALGAALLHRPRLLILDEPTAALDPLGRRLVRGLLQGLRQEGVAVFLNSHLLSEVERVADHVVMVRRGQVVAAGSLSELAGTRVEVTVRAAPLDGALRQALGALGRVGPAGEGRVTVILEDPERVPEVAAAVHTAGARLYELSPRTRSLEDLFIDLTGWTAVPEVLVIARFYLRELLTRKVIWLMVGAGLAAVGLFGYAVDQTASRMQMNAFVRLQSLAGLLSAMLTLGAIYSAIAAIFTAVSTVAADIDTGRVQMVVSRPVSRAQAYLGQFLGLGTITATFTAGAYLCTLLAFAWAAGVRPQGWGTGLAVYLIGPLALTAVAMLLSIRLSPLTAGVSGLIFMLLSWVGWIVERIGYAGRIETLQVAGVLTSLLSPGASLNEWVLALLTEGITGGVNLDGAPTPSGWMLAYGGAYAAAALLAGLQVFRRRDL